MNIGCPRHWPDLYLCDLSCIALRMEFLRAAEALRQYWLDRARGVRPDQREEVVWPRR